VTGDGSDGHDIVERIADERSPQPDEAAELSDLGTVLDSGMAKLSENHRQALFLREVDGLSYREVAAAQGVSIGTVMSRLFHARRRLRRLVEARIR